MAKYNSKIVDWWHKQPDRTRLAVKNIIGMVGVRLLSILISLAIVPLTISYLDPTKYGIWMTISTIIVLVTYFDMGLANGFRNRFTEAKANNDLKLARQYVSTTYFLISMIMGLCVMVICLVNPFINWSEILNINQSYNDELHKVVIILVVIFCITLIVNIFSKLLIADQLPALASIISLIGQIFSLIAIILLKKFSEGSLVLLAFFYSSIPPLLTLIVSIIMFNTNRYRSVSPSFSNINLRLSKNILGIGVKLFIIQIMLIVIVQLINLIISRNIGPIAVAQYNVEYKYFSIVLMIAGLVISPFWSAFTDAHSRKDYIWMRNVMNKIDKYTFFNIGLSFIMLVCSNIFFKLWVGKELTIPFEQSITVAIFCLAQTTGFIYMTIMNGLGKVQLQMCIFIVFGIIAFPVMSYLCRQYGIFGVLIIPSLTYVSQAIFLRLQIKKILEGKAHGIWNK